MIFENIEYFDNDILCNLDSRIFQYSLMSDIERKFLNGIVRKEKPKKILELGVCAGGSSAIILNAIKYNEDAFLYSVDYIAQYHDGEQQRDIGFCIPQYAPHLMDKWKLYTGGTAAEFLEEIGGDIDMCLIDTVHINPGELLDYLMILPFMKQHGIIVLHDISLHLTPHHENSITNCILFSAMQGDKTYPKSENVGRGFPNIGAAIIDKESQIQHITDILMLLGLEWTYMPTQKDCDSMLTLFSKHYDTHTFNLIQQIFVSQTKTSIIREELKKAQHEIYIKKRQYKKKWWFLCIPTRVLRQTILNAMLKQYGLDEESLVQKKKQRDSLFTSYYKDNKVAE